MALSNIANSVRSACCDAFVDSIDVGTTDASGDLQIYTAAFGTLLGELDFSATAFGAASNGVATANAITDEDAAPADGTADVLRIRNRDNATVCEGTVGTSGSGEDLELTNTSISEDDIISVSSATITFPASA